MLISVNNGSLNGVDSATAIYTVLQDGVYASLFEKINLTPVAELGDLNGVDSNSVMVETSTDANDLDTWTMELLS